jgi:antitoxin ParD1/3/4
MSRRAYHVGMATMNLSLPEDLKDYVDERVARGGYGTSSEYLRELIRRDQDRETLRNLLLEGAASPLEGPADDAYFEELRELARQNARK